MPEESLTLVRAEGTNWDPDAGKVAKIEIKAMPDARTRLKRPQDGGPPPSTSAGSAPPTRSSRHSRSRRAAPSRSTRSSFRNVLGVYMRAQGDLAKPEVRQAVAYSSDPAAVSALFSDTCTPRQQLFPAGSWAAGRLLPVPVRLRFGQAKRPRPGRRWSPEDHADLRRGHEYGEARQRHPSMLAAAGSTPNSIRCTTARTNRDTWPVTSSPWSPTASRRASIRPRPSARTSRDPTICRTATRRSRNSPRRPRTRLCRRTSAHHVPGHRGADPRGGDVRTDLQPHQCDRRDRQGHGHRRNRLGEQRAVRHSPRGDREVAVTFGHRHLLRGSHVALCR
ncbi:hypothetical protein GS474_10600 [Rhodococcus hoagii]|nr:hypothetical protein [Prescottella equi]